MEVKPNEIDKCLSENGGELQGCVLEGLEASELLDKMEIVLLMTLLSIFGSHQSNALEMIQKIEEEIHEKYLDAERNGEISDDK